MINHYVLYLLTLFFCFIQLTLILELFQESNVHLHIG